jgi:hypothetical protein
MTALEDGSPKKSAVAKGRLNDALVCNLPWRQKSGDSPALHLELPRYKQMLDWIVEEALTLFHDGSMPCVAWPP